MLDFNPTPKFADDLNGCIDAALVAENATRVARDYLGGSRVGHPCERALQFEFAGAPKDDGGDFSGRTLRIFGIGHALEELAIHWLRTAGVDLYTRKGNDPEGQQFGFSVAGGRIRGHVDGVINAAPEFLGLGVPALWECKTMNAKNWRDTVKNGVTAAKPVYAAQIALYQAYTHNVAVMAASLYWLTRLVLVEIEGPVMRRDELATRIPVIRAPAESASP